VRDASAADRGTSLARMIAQATSQLEQAGVQNGGREATSLWAALADVAPGEAWIRRDRSVSASDSVRFWEAIERRSSGTPFAYAVGRAAFRHLELKVDRRALIPRPETEGLVDLVLQWGKRDQGRATGGCVADIGTGCGCIALSLAVEGNFERVIAVERSPDAAALARENVELIGPAVSVEVREGHLLAPLGDGRFRVIIANPPYLTTEEYDALDLSVRGFEPREALVSGPDGLDATRTLLTGARARLEPDGLLALEIDERRADTVRELACAAGWERTTIREDLFGRPRYALMFPREEA
jgi:release factor glutamine methyltransferase